MKNSASSQTIIGVGIDTARYGHRVTFLREDKQPAAKPLDVLESREGYTLLKESLERLHSKHPEACFNLRIDAAGQYAKNLQTFLESLPLPLSISVGEPKRNKDYHKAVSPKRSTDATESYAMARYAVVERPSPTLPVPEEFYVLREIISRLEGVVRDTTRCVNRLHNVLARVFPELSTIVDNVAANSILTMLEKYPTAKRIAAARLESLQGIQYLREEKAAAIHQAAKQSVGSLHGELAESLVRESVERVNQCLKSQKKLEAILVQAYQALLPSGHLQVASILGIGDVTAAVLVSKIISIDRFATPENLVGYFGIFPEENTSGFDRRGQPVKPGTMQMSAKGSDIVRRYLFNAAKSAIRCNPAVRSLYQRLVGNGKRGDVALGHCMRKLLHLVFAVWSTNTPFNPRHYNWEPEPPAENETSGQSQSSPPSPAVQTDSRQTSEPKEEKAAGHKRDVLPVREVVTATESKIGTDPTIVNEPTSAPKKSQSVDYAFLRSQITFEQVLTHLGQRDKLRGTRSELRGPCPLHQPEKTDGRKFSVNLDKNVFRCFSPSCNKKGNVLDFWAALQKLPLHPAALHLANTFNLQITPEQRRGARNAPKPPTPEST
jgi:transposase